MNDRIHPIGPAQLEWDFHGSSPTFNVGKRYKISHKVDPFPCYAHDVDLVESMAEMIESIFPVGFPVDYFVPQFEDLGRTNGFANKESVYDEKTAKWAGFSPYVVFLGKRIPPHPAMTRYLVAHEYGHIVQWWLEHVRGIKDETTTDMDREYMQFRSGTDNEYGGGRWHSNVGELIANDFRTLVCGVESEFWPHPGIARPEDVPAVIDFWNRARADVWKQ